MELNDQVALELLAALDGAGYGTEKTTGTEQRRGWPLLSQNQQDFYKNLDGFWQTVDPTGAVETSATEMQGRSKTSPTSLAEQQATSIGQTTQFVDNFGDAYSVFAQNTTQVIRHDSQENQASAQTVSRAFQRDARRYAP